MGFIVERRSAGRISARTTEPQTEAVVTGDPENQKPHSIFHSRYPNSLIIVKLAL